MKKVISQLDFENFLQEKIDQKEELIDHIHSFLKEDLNDIYDYPEDFYHELMILMECLDYNPVYGTALDFFKETLPSLNQIEVMPKYEKNKLLEKTRIFVIHQTTYYLGELKSYNNVMGNLNNFLFDYQERPNTFLEMISQDYV